MMRERRDPGTLKTDLTVDRAVEPDREVAATSGAEALERGRRRMGLLCILAGAALMALAFLDVTALL